MKDNGLVTISIRITREDLERLIDVANRIGHGATVTGVVRQAVWDKIRQVEADTRNEWLEGR